MSSQDASRGRNLIRGYVNDVWFVESAGVDLPSDSDA